MFKSLIEKYNDVKTKRENGDGGFTLIELLVVVVIIGILIAIAIPLYLNYQKGAKDKSAQSDLRGAVSALQQCYADNNNAYPAAGTGGIPATASGGSVTMTCGGTSETANLSDGTNFTYSVTGTVATMTTTNTGGNNKTYSYQTDTGKITTA